MSVKRVLLAGVKHEANTFVPGLTTLESFRRRHLLEGQAVFGPERGRGQEIDRIVQVAEAEGIELIPTVAAQASPSGPVEDSAYEFLLPEWWRGRERRTAGWMESSSVCTGRW